MASPTALSTALTVPPKNTSRIRASNADSERIRPYSTTPWPRLRDRPGTRLGSRLARTVRTAQNNQSGRLVRVTGRRPELGSDLEHATALAQLGGDPGRRRSLLNLA